MFYIPSVIKQFESRNGKYFWLNNTNLQILNETDGKLIKSIEIESDKFLFDSQNNIVLINKKTKEINYFNDLGILQDMMAIDNYRDGLDLIISKDDELILFDKTSKKILLI